MQPVSSIIILASEISATATSLNFSSLFNVFILSTSSDMKLNIDDYLFKGNDIGFVVHAPELFEGSHLMDLATPDEMYRKKWYKVFKCILIS